MCVRVGFHVCVRVGVHVCVRVGIHVCVLWWAFMAQLFKSVPQLSLPSYPV